METMEKCESINKQDKQRIMKIHFRHHIRRIFILPGVILFFIMKKPDARLVLLISLLFWSIEIEFQLTEEEECNE